MKRWNLRTALALTLVFTGFVVGIMIDSVPRAWRNAVVVEVQNATVKNIEKVILTHEKGDVQIFNLGASQKHTLVFFPRGEAEYTLKAYFSDGNSVEGLGVNVEPGYAVKETIHEDKIETRNAP